MDIAKNVPVEKRDTFIHYGANEIDRKQYEDSTSCIGCRPFLTFNPKLYRFEVDGETTKSNSKSWKTHFFNLHLL